MGLALPLGAAILAIPPIIARLGNSRFGVLSLGWVAIAYFGILDLGMGRAVTRFSAQAVHRGDVGRVSTYVSSAILVQVFTGGVAASLMVISTPYLVVNVFDIPVDLRAEARTVFYVLATALPLLMIAASLKGVLEASQRFDLVNLIRSPFSAAVYLIPAAVLVVGGDLITIAWVLVASQAVALAAYMAALRRVLLVRITLAGVQWSIVRMLLSFGGWITISNLAGPLLVYLDRGLLASIVSIGAVTYYVTPYEMVTRLWLIPAAVASALFPRFSAEGGVSGRLPETGLLMARGLKLILVLEAGLIIGFVVLADDILRVWLGQEFASRSHAVLRILALGVLVNSLAQIPFALLQGAGRADLPGRFHLVELPMHIVIVWVLVSKWGLTGAAAAWSIRVVVDAALLMIAAHRLRLWGVPDLRSERVFFALLVTGVCLTGGLLIEVMEMTPLLQVGAWLAISALFALGTWGFALTHGERQRVLAMVPAGRSAR